MKKKTKPTGGQIDRVLLWIVLILVVFGVLSLLSASSVLSYQNFGNNYYYITRQLLLGALPGFILMYLFSKFDYHNWQKWAPVLIMGGIVLLVAVLIPGIGVKVSGARRWINLRLFLFQPAEPVKLAVIFYLASWFDKREQRAQDLYYGFLPSLLIVALVAGLVVLQPDIGSMLVLASIAAAMFFASGVKLRYIFATAMAGLLLLWVLIKQAPYRAQRFLAFLDPTVDARGISYQINQALVAIGSGGWWGSGIGGSLQKQALPESIGDSIFAVMAQELGFLRVSLLLLLFAFFGIRGFQLARKAPDTFGRLLTIGIVSWLVIQALINIGGITGVIPLTGIPLTFISYGSTSMAVSLAAVGILLNISKQADEIQPV